MMPTKPPLHRPARPVRAPNQAAPRDPAVAKVHNSHAWQLLRDSYRARHPLCEDPFKHHERAHRVEPATSVHHKQSIKQAPHLALVESNLMAVCRDCHEAMDRANDRSTWQGPCRRDG